ncbi:MAG: nicotinamide-nucleotide adenylyltransferase [Desulfurococcales archaeon]|nr:nicotinamide-nucleotide adenylyltransferase [Desulfurococcales archaeon]
MRVKRFSRLVVPGRFQPLHEGHLRTIDYTLELSHKAIIVIGSAQESFTLSNPLTAGERFELLETALEERYGDAWPRRISIVPVLDIQMNKVWVQYLRQLLPRFDGVVSGNQLVLALFEDMGLEAIEPPLYRREYCSGTVIRRLVLEGDDKWRECVPPSVIRKLEEYGFEERLRRLYPEGNA